MQKSAQFSTLLRATQKYGVVAEILNDTYNLINSNGLTAGVTDTAATWAGGGARLLGDALDSQALKDFAARADNVKRQVRINHDINRGDSTFSNIVYGAGTIAPEMILPASQIKLGAGIAGNALRGAGYGALGGGLTSLLDSDQAGSRHLVARVRVLLAAGCLAALALRFWANSLGMALATLPKRGFSTAQSMMRAISRLTPSLAQQTRMMTRLRGQ